MKIEEVPRAFRYFCDGCQASHLQNNAGGHYSESVPPRWTKAHVITKDADCKTARDETALLCSRCTEAAKKELFNSYMDRMLATIFGLTETDARQPTQREG